MIHFSVIVVCTLLGGCTPASVAGPFSTAEECSSFTRTVVSRVDVDIKAMLVASGRAEEPYSVTGWCRREYLL